MNCEKTKDELRDEKAGELGCSGVGKPQTRLWPPGAVSWQDGQSTLGAILEKMGPQLRPAAGWWMVGL